MKKKLILVLIIVLISILPYYAVCETFQNYLPSDTAAGYLYDTCPWREDGLAVLGSNGIWLFQPLEKTLNPVFRFEKMPIDSSTGKVFCPDRIFSSEKNLYLFSSRSGQCFVLKDHSLESTFEELTELFFYDDQSETKRKTLINLVPGNNGAFLLLESITFTDGLTHELYFINPENRVIHQFGKIDINILYSCSGNTLLAGKVSDDRNLLQLYLIDTEKGTISEWIDHSYSAEAVGFVKNENILCYIDEGGQLFIKRDSHIFTVASIPYEHFSSSARCLLWGNHYIFLQEGVLNLRELNYTPHNIVTLRILGHVSNQIIREYMAKRPDINIVFDSREDQFLGLQEALLSKDSQIDLFVVESDGLYNAVIEKGYAAPLTNSAKLTEKTVAFYPWVKSILQKDEKLFAIPVGVKSEYWTLNRTMWEKIGMIDDPQTYTDIFDAMILWDDQYADKYPQHSLFESMDGTIGMIRAIIRQYLLLHEDWNAPVDFNTDEFRTAIINVMDHSEIFIYDGESIPLIMNYPQYLGQGYNDSDIVESIIPPSLTENSEQAVRSTLEMLMVNPLSVHPEESILFLEFYLDHLDTEISYQIDASLTMPLRKKDYEETVRRIRDQIQFIQAQQAKTDDSEAVNTFQKILDKLELQLQREENEWLYSPVDIEIYHRIANKIVVPTRTVYPEGSGNHTEAFDQVIDRFANENLSIDQFIRDLNEKSRIIFLEAM